MRLTQATITISTLASIFSVVGPATATSLPSTYRSIDKVMLYCETEPSTAAQAVWTAPKICEAAKNALEEIARGQLNNDITKHSTWRFAMDPTFKEKCQKDNTCVSLMWQIQPIVDTFPVIIIDKLEVDTFNDYKSFIIWINTTEINRNFCGQNASALVIVWRVIYEGHEKYSYGTAYETAPRDNIISMFKYGGEFQNRARPMLPLLLCENTNIEKRTIIDSFKVAFTSWFEPYLINDMNHNAAMVKKP